MRILVYGLNYAPEVIGIGRYTRGMCEWLAARGHQLKVVTSYPYYPDWKIAPPYSNGWYGREQRNGISVIRCPLYVPAKPTGPRRLLNHLSFAVSSAPVVAATALRFRPGVVLTIAPSQLAAPVAFFAARISGAHSWLHVQDFEVDSAFELGLLAGRRLRRCAEWIERAMLTRFERVSTISPKMIERLVSKQVPASRIVEFRNWVDTSVIRPVDRMTRLRGELGLTNEIIALYSGSMALKQGLDILIETARMLKDTKPEVVIVICGKGAVCDRLKEQAKDLTNVRFLDLQPEDRLAELLSTADIHLLPQRTEIADLVLPSKLAPMLASGRPIVAMSKAGDQLAAEVTGVGLVIPADDAAALGSALTALAGDPELRNRLGQAGRRKAEERWDMKAILTRWEADLSALAGARPHDEAVKWPTEQMQ